VIRANAFVPKGRDLVHAWVKILEMPFGLRNREALAYLVHEYTTILECDMYCLTKSDLPCVQKL
jgi:hypothetical protein